MNQPKTITYVVTEKFVYYGIVKNQEVINNCIILGPITNVAFSKEMLKEVLLDASPTLRSTPQISDIFNTFPLIVFERFLHTADNSIRQIKNLFIATTTLVTRAAIKGGVDMESAYQLSDIYIQQMEKLQSLESIYSLQYQMVFDYTERVLATKIPSGISLIVYECINYIKANTNQPITVTDVTTSVKKSRSFISRKFMQELGFGINEFINSRKLEEAKYLLTYSNKSLCEISFYLCFSSQSYFQNVFKKKLGITPNEYRLKTSSN